MDRSQQHPWIQVIGRIAVHRPGRDSHEPKGASRVLLSILVAAGPGGASLEEIANAYWTQSRPTSWKIALRVSASHLGAQLPDGWAVAANDGRFRLVPGDGFIDVWRVQEYSSDRGGSEAGAAWLDTGAPFTGVTGIDIVDTAIQRLVPLIDELAATVADQKDHRLPFSGTDEEKSQWIQGLRRAILVAPPGQHKMVAHASAADDVTETHVVIGDRRLLLPLGPFAMAFPELRNEIRLEQGAVEAGSAAQAFRIVTDTLAVQAAFRPQRLVLANAHELDTKSMKMASMLIDQGRLSDFSLIVCADHTYRDIRWLDFVRRSVTAGCDLIEFTPD